MGILSRFGDIMRANINDLLTGAENKNAEKLLNQYLRDAREDYAQVKNETASVMAEEAAAKRRLDEIDDQIARYERYAQAAVQAGNDADALKFLEAKGQLQPLGTYAPADQKAAGRYPGGGKQNWRAESQAAHCRKQGEDAAAGREDRRQERVGQLRQPGGQRAEADRRGGREGSPQCRAFRRHGKELEALKARMGGGNAAPAENSDAAAQLAAMKAQMGEGSI